MKPKVFDLDEPMKTGEQAVDNTQHANKESISLQLVTLLHQKIETNEKPTGQVEVDIGGSSCPSTASCIYGNLIKVSVFGSIVR